MIEYFSRREFIGKSALMAGGALGSLAIGRNMVLAETEPVNRIEFLENRCHENQQKIRILVTYASRCGATGGVAGAIAGTFCDKGALVDVLRVESVSDLTPYHGVVIGSAIRSDHWLPEAVDFVEQHQKVLSRVPVAYFLTCLTLAKNTKENRKRALGYMEPVTQKTSDVIPLDIGLFAGALEYDKLPFMMRIIMKMKMQNKGVDEGDYRDFKSIRSWAKGIAPVLLSQSHNAIDKAS
ncbi:MAG: flavodoxin domain-containing protein [Deltaproteobacteria bacterium]|nr:flavodoxin domain-containing protein [Deltaproteobacteria bacterium]